MTLKELAALADLISDVVTTWDNALDDVSRALDEYDDKVSVHDDYNGLYLDCDDDDYY